MVERILFKDLKYLSAKYDFCAQAFSTLVEFCKDLKYLSAKYDFCAQAFSTLVEFCKENARSVRLHQWQLLPPLINRTLALIWPLSLQRGTNVHLFDKNKYAFALGNFCMLSNHFTTHLCMTCLIEVQHRIYRRQCLLEREREGETLKKATVPSHF